MTTDRTSFNETWLSESPSRIKPVNFYPNLLDTIKDLISYNKQPIDLGNGYFKIVMESLLYYWYEDANSVIQLIIELSKCPQGLRVNLVGKNPSITGQKPFASDLYNAILNDTKKGIRITSDTQLSDEGLNIWKRLYSCGHVVSIYNNEFPGKTFHTINDMKEFNDYFGDSPDFKKYQFVLNELSFLPETRCYFNTRAIRESFNYDLAD